MATTLSLAMISDTHGNYDADLCGEVDLFLPAGDLCRDRGNEMELRAAIAWISQVKARYRIVISGNHDTFLYERPRDAEAMLAEAGIIYLRDKSIEIEGIKIYGSPWTEARFGFSFELSKGELIEKWREIPPDVDILITHTPPLGVLDLATAQDHQGCEFLGQRLVEIKPRLHLFGHIHESYGCLLGANHWSVNAAIGLFPAEDRLPIFAKFYGDNGKSIMVRPCR